MFEHFTEAARRSLFFARIAAGDRGGTCIDPEDLLRGILLAAPAAALRFGSETAPLDPGASPDELAARVLADAGSLREIPLSRQVVLALEQADEEARALGQPAIRPEHLLLGLLRDETTLASQSLSSSGISPSRLRRALRDAAGSRVGAEGDAD